MADAVVPGTGMPGVASHDLASNLLVIAILVVLIGNHLFQSFFTNTTTHDEPTVSPKPHINAPDHALTTVPLEAVVATSVIATRSTRTETMDISLGLDLAPSAFIVEVIDAMYEAAMAKLREHLSEQQYRRLELVTAVEEHKVLLLQTIVEMYIGNLGVGRARIEEDE